MQGSLNPVAGPRRRKNERGVVAIVVALILTTLLIVTAMVLDFGLVRVDRQTGKSAADSAALAGLQAMSGGESAAPYRGVCTALRFLRENDRRFSGVTSATGIWTDAGSPPVTKGNGCTDTTLQNQFCTAGDPSSWARFTWNGTWQGGSLKVVIQSGYELNGSGWQEETLPAVSADNNDGQQGCDQLAVVIRQTRKPGLGSLAGTSDLVSEIRSVGRVQAGPGGNAPALLLLKRSGCPILSTGGSGGGSFIRVYGAVSSDGKSQGGSIHADSTGASCSGGSNQNIFIGGAPNGIVAYAAPLVSNPSAPDPTKPGQITTVAGANGISGNSGIIRDKEGAVWDSRVYSAGGINESSPGTKSAPLGRPRVTRKVVDVRYLSGVKNIVDAAQTNVFGSLTAATAPGTVVGCNATGSVSGTDIFVDCLDNNGFRGPITFTDATRVVFNGRVNPQGTVAMPKAKQVYIFGKSGSPALDLGNNSSFVVHTDGANVDATGKCSSATSTDKAILVIKDGQLKQTAGLLQMCHTTAIMMSGYAGACLPSVGYSVVDPPKEFACGASARGTGQLSQQGGAVDWTAPNHYDNMTLTDGTPDPAKSWAWSDPNGPEDLAFWTESGSGTDQASTYNMAGGGNLHAVGVYMVPNAEPFTISGGSFQALVNAQYIASTIVLNGNNTSLSMKVDPNAAVTLPKTYPVGLVR